MSDAFGSMIGGDFDDSNSQTSLATIDYSQPVAAPVMDEEDFIIPQLKLLQAMSPETNDENLIDGYGVRAGLWYPADRPATKKLIVKVRSMYKTRSFNKQVGKESYFMCFSKDAVNGNPSKDIAANYQKAGLPGDPIQSGQACQTCPFSKNGCDLKYNYVITITDDEGNEQPYVMTLKRTGTATARAINSMIMRHTRNGVLEPFYVELGVETRDGQAGSKFYVPTAREHVVREKAA